jgi:4-diphosphocytidyl-2C-methyl-D-erythritol kinase
MQERWSALEAQAAAANEAAEEAKASAAAAQDNLAALSTAYNDLEAHAFKLEEQLKQQELSEQQQQQGAAKAGAGVLTEAEVEARIKEALDQVGVVGKGSCTQNLCYASQILEMLRA